LYFDRESGTFPLVLWIAFWYVPLEHMAATIASTRETSPAAPVPRRQPRRFWSQALLFVACVLLVNAVVGDKGLMDTLRARKSRAAAAGDLARLKRENAALRDQVRRLRTDPATIEAVARRELGLVRPGEILVTVRDVK
jgi:cell division protein FtsB